GVDRARCDAARPEHLCGARCHGRMGSGAARALHRTTRLRLRPHPDGLRPGSGVGRRRRQSLTPTLEVRDLTITLRGAAPSIVAVKDASFAILPGRTLGLVGESGAGKSLTSMSIPGLLPRGDIEMRGSIRLLGRELVGLPER